MKEWQREAFGLQLITHRVGEMDEVEGARRALEGGCRWVQLRMKEACESEIEAKARVLRRLCDTYKAVLIIDDYVELAVRVGADGVHLGKKDMSVERAREMVGNEFVIGGTCNTMEDILAVKDWVDYVGVGPYRFTTTKKGLAPVLGLEGYERIVSGCRQLAVNVPIVAIGGIVRSDVRGLMESGVQGVAISGGILRAEDVSGEARAIGGIVGELLNAKARR